MTIRNDASALGAAALIVAMGACATATLLPKADGTVAIIGNGYAENAALEAALDKGIAYCRAGGNTFAVLSRQSRYQGIPPTAQAAINIAGVVSKEPIQGMGTRPDDWRVELEGVCQ